jgi:hypothetical protein
MDNLKSYYIALRHSKVDWLKVTPYFRQGNPPQPTVHLQHGAFISPYAASAIEIGSQHTPHSHGIIERTGIETMAAAAFASLPELVRCLAEQVRVTQDRCNFSLFLPLLTRRSADPQSQTACPPVPDELDIQLSGSAGAVPRGLLLGDQNAQCRRRLRPSRPCSTTQGQC